MRTLFLDTETFSSVDLRKSGVHPYSESDDAEILLLQWAFDDEEPKDVDLTAGESIPDEVARAMQDGKTRVVIHNAPFDWTMLRACLGVEIPLSQIWDTAAQARSLALPAGLGQLCEIFKVDAKDAKKETGKDLIRFFCMPKKPTKADPGTRRLPKDYPELWAAFREYGRADISAMRAVYRKMPAFNYPAEGWQRAIYELDFKITNITGVKIDVDFAREAVRAANDEAKRLSASVEELTDGEVAGASRVAALLEHMLAYHNIYLPDLKKDTVAKELKRAEQIDGYPEEVRALLEVRQQASLSSVSKYKAMLNTVCNDGRIRGLFQYLGASRTGRWAGRYVQMQNLSKPIGGIFDDVENAARKRDGKDYEEGAATDELVEDIIEATKGGFETLIDSNVMKMLSGCVRGAFIPESETFAICDLSAIEGRVLPWLAGEEKELDIYRSGKDIYLATYGSMFGVPYESMKKATHKKERQVGKVATLALGYAAGVSGLVAFARDNASAIASMVEIPDEFRDDLAKSLTWAKKKRGTFGLTDKEYMALDCLKLAWRAAHPKTVAFWNACEEAFRSAIANPGAVFRAGKVAVKKSGMWLMAKLPSGRMLVYPGAYVDEKDGVGCYGMRPVKGRGYVFTKGVKLYGGLIAENFTQATARDVLAFGLLNAEREGATLVGHVHDEIIAENFTSEELNVCMTTNVPWAEGLPLAGAGEDARRYKK